MRIWRPIRGRKKRVVMDRNDFFLTPGDLEQVGHWREVFPGVVEGKIPAWPGSTCFYRQLYDSSRGSHISLWEQIAWGDDATAYLRQVQLMIDTLPQVSEELTSQAEGKVSLLVRRISLPPLGDETAAYLKRTIRKADEAAAIDRIRGRSHLEIGEALALLDELKGWKCQQEATAWVRLGNEMAVMASLTVISRRRNIKLLEEAAVTRLESVASAATVKALKVTRERALQAAQAADDAKRR
jgi:hypothetical protein